jgi:hypothetical protein
MAEVHRTIHLQGDKTLIRFQQYWTAVTYHTEAGYGIDRIPKAYAPIGYLVDNNYTFTTKVYPGEIVNLPPVGNGKSKDVYIVELDFMLPAEEATFYCLQYPRNQFRIAD